MTKTEQARLWAWRCKVLREASSEARNIARTCRHFGISRQAFYRWKRRFEATGEAGLWDRSTRPHRSPTAIAPAVISKILYLRQQYHFGAGRIAELFDSHPGPTAGRIGTFLVAGLYQGSAVACAMFFTGQASNLRVSVQRSNAMP